MSHQFSLVLGTNIWSHHQVPLATELAKILGPAHFRMALFEEVHEERISMGWAEHGDHSWVIGPPRNEKEKKGIVQQCLSADVMVFGACPMEVLKARVAAGKLTLVASERLIKKGFHALRLLNPRYAMGFRRYRALVNHPHIHALAKGHYAPDDLRTIGAFGDRIWKWGYIADVNPGPPEPLPDRPVKILWAGRMLTWKKVDVLLQALAQIHSSTSFGECVIVGDGPERDHLLRLHRRLRLHPDRVRFQRSVPFDTVRLMMRGADVCVLPSNRQEGWGVVANEAMSEGCVLVANEQAGAARVLVADGETGFLFRDGDVTQLASLLNRLATEYPLRMRVRRQAWQQMHALWSPRVAAERIVALSSGLLGLTHMPDFKQGLCFHVGDSR